jgi:CBS domain-containing protein
MQVTNWMTPNPVCVGPRASLAKAGALMAARGFRQLPVVDNGKLIGIVLIGTYAITLAIWSRPSWTWR